MISALYTKASTYNYTKCQESSYVTGACIKIFTGILLNHNAQNHFMDVVTVLFLCSRLRNIKITHLKLQLANLFEYDNYIICSLTLSVCLISVESFINSKLTTSTLLIIAAKCNAVLPPC